MSPRPCRRQIPSDSETQLLLIIDELAPRNEFSIDAVVHLPVRGTLSPTTASNSSTHDHQRAAMELPGCPVSRQVRKESLPTSTVSTKPALRSPLKPTSKEPHGGAQFLASGIENIQSGGKAGDWQRTPGRRLFDAAPAMAKRERTMAAMPTSLVAPWARRPAPAGTPSHRPTTQRHPTTVAEGDSTVTRKPVVCIPSPSQSASTINYGTLEPTPKKQPPTSSRKPLSQSRNGNPKPLSPSQRLQQVIQTRRQRLASSAKKDVELAEHPVPLTPEPASVSVATTTTPGPSRQATLKRAAEETQRHWSGKEYDISDEDVLRGLRIICAASADAELDALVTRRTGLRLRRFLADLQSLERLGGFGFGG